MLPPFWFLILPCCPAADGARWGKAALGPCPHRQTGPQTCAGAPWPGGAGVTQASAFRYSVTQAVCGTWRYQQGIRELRQGAPSGNCKLRGERSVFLEPGVQGEFWWENRVRLITVLGRGKHWKMVCRVWAKLEYEGPCTCVWVR